MTDPKTAARTVATRLADRDIAVKHVQALDLVAAGCGFQDRSKLSNLAELPRMRSVHARLLSSAALVLARHDAARRATIVDVVTSVLVPPVASAFLSECDPTDVAAEIAAVHVAASAPRGVAWLSRHVLDMRDVRGRGAAIHDGPTTGGVVPFLVAQADAMRSFSQGMATGRVVRDATSTSEELLAWISDRSDIGAEPARRPCVIAATPEAGDAATLFRGADGDWGGLATALVLPDRSGPLVTEGMPGSTRVRFMDVADAALRASVDACLESIAGEDGSDFDPTRADPENAAVPIDYDRVAAMIAVAGVFRRAKGPLEIALLDGAQRAEPLVRSLHEDPGTPGGRVARWVADVADAFRVAIPSEGRMRNLLTEGDAAVSGIRASMRDDDVLQAWLAVTACPDLVADAVDPVASGVVPGVPLPPALTALGGNHPPLATVDLDGERERAAQDSYETYDFPSPVVDHGGWERATPGDEWSRTVLVEDNDGDADADADAPSIALRFSVRFLPGTAAVADAEARDGNGAPVGHSEATTPSPLLRTVRRVATVELAGDRWSHRPSVDVELDAAGLASPHAVDDATMTAILDHLTAESGFTRWEASSNGLRDSTLAAIAVEALDGLRKATTPEERAVAVDRAIVANVGCDDPWRDWCDHGHDAWTSLSTLIAEAAEEAGLGDSWDADAWDDAMPSLYEERVSDDDDSTPTDVLGRGDEVEMLFHLARPGEEGAIRIAGPWNDSARVVPDDAFRFAIAKLGVDLDAWRAEVGVDDGSDDGSAGAAVEPIDGGPLADVAKLRNVIDNGCSQDFGLCLYARLPMADLLALDPSRPFAVSKVRLALYDGLNGTFHDVAVRPGPVTLRDGIDGVLSVPTGHSPHEMCGLVGEFYRARLSDPALDAAAEAADGPLADELARLGLTRRFPGHRIGWRFADAARTTIAADVGVDDRERRFSNRAVAAATGPDGTVAVSVADDGPRP